MLTYQTRPRVLKIIGNVAPSFPAEVVVNFYLQPRQAFGDSNIGGRLFIQNGAGQGILFDANSGQYTTNTNGAMKPLRGESTDGLVSVNGHMLTQRIQCRNAQDLHSKIESIHFTIPLLLSLEFADPPFVERVDGTIGGISFRWELAQLMMQPRVISLEGIGLAYTQAFAHIDGVIAPERRPLLAALSYFYTGSRLLREAKTPGEFMSEAILNFSKVLEILFGTKPLEDVRDGLRVLWYSSDEIERDFISIIDLRNSMDVGHPGLSILNSSQLETVHWFAERSERVMVQFLNRLIEGLRSGAAKIKQRIPGPPDATTAKVLERLTQLRNEHGLDRP